MAESRPQQPDSRLLVGLIQAETAHHALKFTGKNPLIEGCLETALLFHKSLRTGDWQTDEIELFAPEGEEFSVRQDILESLEAVVDSPELFSDEILLAASGLAEIIREN